MGLGLRRRSDTAASPRFAVLDIMEHVLSAEDAGLQYLRVDGSVPGQERARIVREFNENARYSLCLLTTGVGSLGLTLTSATRVVIYDLSWNPSTDCQGECGAAECLPLGWRATVALATRSGGSRVPSRPDARRRDVQTHLLRLD